MLHFNLNKDDYKTPLSLERRGASSSFKYWTSLGLCESQLRQPLVSSPLQSSEEILKDIEKINYKFFDNVQHPSIPIVSIDGVCCCGKSTLCFKYEHIKTNKYITSVGMNSNPCSALGYYNTSLKLMDSFVREHKDSKAIILSDRTPWNNYMWSIIWKLIASVDTFSEDATATKNSYTTLNDITTTDDVVFTDFILNVWAQLMSTIYAPTLKDLITSTVPIFIVDSNEINVKNRMRQRNTGSDLERSNWDYYVALQNYAYAFVAAKYPEHICIIDISRYENVTQEVVLQAVEKLLETHFAQFAQNNPSYLKYDNSSSSIICQKLSFDGDLHERHRPACMDEFYSNLKIEYVNLRNREDTKKPKCKKAKYS